MNVKTGRKKFWLLTTSAIFFIFSLISVIENSLYRVEDYFVYKSMITVAGKAEACTDISPRPTLALAEENKRKVCALFMNGGNHNKLPREIKEFVNLEELYLASNLLTSLPKEISSLKIRKLDLGKNQFLKIPSSVFDLIYLEKLETGFNRIRMLQRDINKLKNLKYLSLNKNKIILLPKTLGELKKLEYLELGNNNLERLPDEIGNLSNLKELYLYSNKLEEIPPEIGSLKNLKNLDLSFNQLKNLPAEIKDLTNLAKINIKGNPLSEKELSDIKYNLPRTEIIF